MLECLYFGTLDKNYALCGELKCRHCFTISNGVRQGGILSPSLFAVYMDDLFSLLNAGRIGCHISDVCINHVFYADELCLIWPHVP